jgi:putative tricarboxylic transport membrane protein
LRKLTETPEWKKYITDNGLKAAFLTGPDFVKWVGEQEGKHKDLLKAGGLIK